MTNAPYMLTNAPFNMTNEPYMLTNVTLFINPFSNISTSQTTKKNQKTTNNLLTLHLDYGGNCTTQRA